MVYSADDNLRLERLICAVADGRADCLDGIYSVAGKRMFAVALSVVGKNFAEDVVHDAFIKIARFAKRYERGTNAYGWILKITRNIALDYLKKRKAHPEVSEEEFYSLTSADYSPEKRENAILLEQAISILEKDERQIIYLKYYIDMTVREIASEMRISKSAAQRLIERAENKLKNILETGQNGK